MNTQGFLINDWGNFTQVNDFIIRDKEISSNEFRIYADLLSYTSKGNNTAFPSIKKLIEDTNLSEKTVKNAIKCLCKLGYIIKQERYKTTANGKVTNDSNLYILCKPNHYPGVKNSNINDNHKKDDDYEGGEENFTQIILNNNIVKEDDEEKINHYSERKNTGGQNLPQGKNCIPGGGKFYTTNNNNINNNHKEDDEEKNTLSQKYKDFFGEINPAIETALKELSKENYLELIHIALDKAALIKNCKNPIAYIQKLLNDWKMKGLKTPEDVDRHIKNNSKRSSTKSNEKKNKFLNFPQTKYNFDEIEQLDMQRQIERMKKEGIIPEDNKIFS